MILVYTNQNPSLVGLAKCMLEDAGLGVSIKNEFTTSGFPPYNLDQELWLINDADLETAREVLSSLQEEDAGD